MYTHTHISLSIYIYIYIYNTCILAPYHHSFGILAAHGEKETISLRQAAWSTFKYMCIYLSLSLYTYIYIYIYVYVTHIYIYIRIYL